MEHGVFPIGFYCRNARLYLKKAAMARKCHAAAEEMEHLRNFKALVSESIFSHPLYSEKKGDRQIVELLGHLTDAKKRLLELESHSGNPPRNSPSPSTSFKNAAGKPKMDKPVSKTQRPASRNSQEIHPPQTPPAKNLHDGSGPTSPHKLRSRTFLHSPSSRMSQEMLGSCVKAQRKTQPALRGMHESPKKLPNPYGQLKSTDYMCVSNPLTSSQLSEEELPDFSCTNSRITSSSSGLLWQENTSQFGLRDPRNGSLKSKKWEQFLFEKSKSPAEESLNLTADGEMDIVESIKHGNSLEKCREQCMSRPSEDFSLEGERKSSLKASIENGECSNIEAGISNVACFTQKFASSSTDSSESHNLDLHAFEGEVYKGIFPKDFEGKLKRNDDVGLLSLHQTSSCSLQSLQGPYSDFLENDNRKTCGLEDTNAGSADLSEAIGFLMDEEIPIKEKFHLVGNCDVQHIEEGQGRQAPKYRTKASQENFNDGWQALYKRQRSYGCHSSLKLGRVSWKTDTLEVPNKTFQMSEDGPGKSIGEPENLINMPGFDESRGILKHERVDESEMHMHGENHHSIEASSDTFSYWERPLQVSLSCEKSNQNPLHRLPKVCKIEQQVDGKVEESEVLEISDPERASGTSKRVGNMSLEQKEGDIEAAERLKVDAKEASDFMGRLTQDVIENDIGSLSSSERQIACGEKLKPTFITQQKMTAENPRSVKFEGLDQRNDVNLPDTHNDTHRDEERKLIDSCEEFVDVDDGLPNLDDEQGRQLECESEVTYSPKMEFDESLSLSSQFSAARAAASSTSSSLADYYQRLRSLEQGKKCGPIWQPPRSSKLPIVANAISHISKHSVKTKFCNERYDLRGYPGNASSLDRTTFSNPVFDFESYDCQIFPEHDSGLDSAVSLPDGDASALHMLYALHQEIESRLSPCVRAGNGNDWVAVSENKLGMGKADEHEISQNKAGGHSETTYMQGKNLHDGSIQLFGSLQAVIDQKNLWRELNKSRKNRTRVENRHSFHQRKTEMDVSESEEEGNIRSFVAPRTISNSGIKEHVSSDESITDEEDSLKVMAMQEQSVSISPTKLENSVQYHSVSDLDQRINVANLHSRMGGLERMVEELKDLVERISVKSKDEDGDGQFKLECLEKEIKDLKEETSHELFEMRKMIKDEIKMKLDQIKSDTECSRETLKINISECSAKLESFQKQMDSTISEAKCIWMKSVEENLANSVEIIKDGFKNDVEQREYELLKDMERFKELIYSELAYIKEDRATPEKSAKQAEILIEENLENCFTDKFSTFLVTKIDVLAEEKLEKWISNKLGNLLTMQTDIWTEEKLETWFSSKTGALLADNIVEGMKNEICLLKAEVEALSKIREEIHRHVELVAETTWADFQRDQSFLKSENDTLKKQLETVRNEGTHIKLMAEDFKKGFSKEIEELRHAVGKMSNASSQNETEGLRDLEEALTLQIVNLSKALDKTEVEVAGQRADFEAFKKGCEGTGVSSGPRLDSTQERNLIMQKMESLSQLYLGGLEEVRTDLLEVKVTCNDRFEEQNKRYEELQRKQENTFTDRNLPSELLSDGSKNQLAQSKSQELLDYLEQEKLEAESILALMKKDKDLAATVAAEAHEAEESLKSMLGPLNNEIAASRWKNTEVQENLFLERNAVATATLDAERAIEDPNKAKEAISAALSEAQRSSQELCEEIARVWQNLKLSLVSVDKQMQSVNTASSRTAAIAAEAEAMLLGISNMRVRAAQLEDGLSETVAKTVDCVKREYSQEVEKAMDGLRSTIYAEVANAKALKDELEEVKRKASPIYRFNFETSNDKPVMQSEVEYFVQKSELAISDLAKSIKEVIDTKDTSSPMRNFLSMEERFATKEEFNLLTKNVERIVIAMDGMNQSPRLVTESKANQESENTVSTVLSSEFLKLETQIKRVSEEQYTLAEKVIAIEKVVFNIEDKQTDVNHGMEQFQVSTFHLETCESPEKKQILSLYKDVEGNAERLRQVQDVGHTARLKSVKEGEGIVRSGDTKKRELLRHSDKRLDTLENRIEHVASAAYTNLRYAL
eukprot:Gb_26687 [translate_table: standard]